MTITISPVQSDVQKAVGLFLQDVLGLPRSSIVAAMPNRVGEPKAGTFVEMTLNRFVRLRTNVDSNADSKFTGTASGLVLTVTGVQIGAVPTSPAAIFGANVVPGTQVTEQLTGTPGGDGTYSIDTDLDIPVEQTFSAGGKTIEIASEATVLLDFHSDGYDSSANAQIVAGAFRDSYGVAFFAALETGGKIAPLYADDPAMRPFVNAEQQFEWRWATEARLQVNQILTVPLQYADSINLFLASVDALYPPTDSGPSLDFSLSSNSQFLPPGL